MRLPLLPDRDIHSATTPAFFFSFFFLFFSPNTHSPPAFFLSSCIINMNWLGWLLLVYVHNT